MSATSNIEWRSATMRAADFDGDGVADHFALGLDSQRRVVAGLVLASQPDRLHRLEFPIEGSCKAARTQDCLEIDSTSGIYQLEGDLTEVLGQPDHDYPGNGCCQGVQLFPTRESDPFNFFWNPSSKKLDWWRA